MSELVYRLLQTQPFPLGRVTAKSILNVLAWRYHDDDLYAFPSVVRLAREVGTTEGHVRKQLRWLRAEGWVAVEHRRRRNGTMTSSAYTFPWLPVELTTPPIPGDRRPGGQNGAHPLSAGGAPPVRTGVASYPPGQAPKTLLENTSRKQEPPSKPFEHAGADEAHASVSAIGSNGNGGLTRLNPADFEAFRRQRQAQRAQAGGIPLPRSLVASGDVGGRG